MKIIDFSSGNVTQVNDRFFVFALLAFEFVFAEANSNYGRRGIGDSGKASVVSDIFSMIDEVGSQETTFIVGTFGGGFVVADAITDGVDIFNGSLEGFIHF